MPNDYPRMLYKVGTGEGEMLWGHRIDTLTVQDAEQEHAAFALGWSDQPTRVLRSATIRTKAGKYLSWLSLHAWKIAGLVIGLVGAVAGVISALK